MDRLAAASSPAACSGCPPQDRVAHEQALPPHPRHHEAFHTLMSSPRAAPAWFAGAAPLHQGAAPFSSAGGYGDPYSPASLEGKFWGGREPQGPGDGVITAGPPTPPPEQSLEGQQREHEQHPPSALGMVPLTCTTPEKTRAGIDQLAWVGEERMDDQMSPPWSEHNPAIPAKGKTAGVVIPATRLPIGVWVGDEAPSLAGPPAPGRHFE